LPFRSPPKTSRSPDPAALQTALVSAQPGDHLILREGEWRDAKIVFAGRGTKAAPITLKAATPGKTVFTGKSTLNLGGEHLVVEGLLFQDPDPELSMVIQFRVDSKQLAQHCRMTDCAMISTRKADSSQESRWVGLYGAGHRVDHCSFQGKSGKALPKRDGLETDRPQRGRNKLVATSGVHFAGEVHAPRD
jgi:poly(beta-D-mannuronate) lyase